MAIARRLNRQLDIDGQLFRWWVREDDDTFDMVLNVARDDKKLHCKCVLGQKRFSPFVDVLNRIGLTKGHKGRWQRHKCPQFHVDGVATPSAARLVADWALQNTPVVDAPTTPRLDLTSYGSRPSNQTQFTPQLLQDAV